MPERILIVGGATGIGAAIADYCRRLGHDDVVVPGQQHSPWASGMMFELDVTDPASIKDYFRQHGGFTHIVYTVGINRLAYVEQAVDIGSIMAVNATGFAEVLAAHGKEYNGVQLQSAVAITSDAAHNPMRGSIAYCASKAALEMMIRVIAREWAPEVRVNGVAPAIVEGTPMTAYTDSAVPEFRGWTAEEANAYELSGLPMGRRVQPNEVAEVVYNTLFGPAYQTGSIVAISGGK